MVPESSEVDVVYRVERPAVLNVVRAMQDPTFFLRLRAEDRSGCPPTLPIMDLAQKQVRAIFSKVYETAVADACGLPFTTVGEASIFYRGLPRQLATVVALVAAPIIASAAIQPVTPQKLRIEVSNLVVAGTVSITGTDANGEALLEVVVVGADGVFYTVTAFATIDAASIEGVGDFDFLVELYDGRVALTFQATDIAAPGLYNLHLEVLDEVSGDRATFPAPVLVHAWDTRPLPVPVVTSLAPLALAAGDLLTVSGTGFLDATGIALTSQVDSSTVSLTGIVVTDETAIEGVVPLGTLAGDYWVSVTGPGGTSTRFGTLTVA